MIIKATSLLYFFAVFQTLIIAQRSTIEVEYGDTQYLTPMVKKGWGTKEVWAFKNDLQQGNYVVVATSECGKDTLMTGTFIGDGVKHGVWAEWEPRGCEQDEGWNFWNAPALNTTTTYDNGFIKKSTHYHMLTNTPHIEYLYPKGAIALDEWTEERIWDIEGKLQWRNRFIKSGRIEQTDFYADGKIKSINERRTRRALQESWKYFHPNGELMAKGTYEAFGKNVERYYTGGKIPKGEWNYWDEAGDLIAKIYFKDGEILRFDRYQSKAIPFPEIEEILNEQSTTNKIPRNNPF